MKFNKTLSIIFISVSMFACNNGPKVIEAESDTNSNTESGIFTNPISNQKTEVASSFSDDLHTVVVKEVLFATRYVYLNVSEGNEKFWIATGKKEIHIGETYFYKRGLLKTNFESKEHNRVFDTIYLVTNLVSRNHGDNSQSLNKVKSNQEELSTTKSDIPTHTEESIEHKGSVKISDIVSNPTKYAGKTVQVSGKCVKVNPRIMDRNWIHLQDGSKDDYDLVVTSQTFVPEGTIITMKALVSIDRDFGAGYTYALILEDGVVVQ